MNYPPLIRIEKLSKWYRLRHGTVEALRLVDLTIYPGEFIALMGPSGSGKSTLLHILGCLESPSSGHYWLDNRDVALLHEAELALVRASQIGFVFQSFNLIPQFNVFENVELPFLYQSPSLTSGEIKERVVTAIEQVHLGHRLYHVPGELSGGESQRVAIARALVMRPLIILADEPTGNLDRENGAAILALFQELNEQGATVIISTHDEFIGKHCQRIVRLLDGAVDEFVPLSFEKR